MLNRGLTEDGAAQALGWPKARVIARVKILELPARAQQLIGEGVIHLAAVDQLRAIGQVAPELLDAVIAYLDDGNAWAAERLTREPGWVLDAALSHVGNSKVFAAYLQCASAHEIGELRLGKKIEQIYADAEKLHRQLDRYAYGPPQVRFTDENVDQARAAGVLIEFDGPSRPIIVDRPLYRELVKSAIKRTHDDLEAKTAAAAQEKKTARAGKQPADPVTLAKGRDAQLRDLTDQARGANLDLGHALVHNLTTVDPTDIDVARFFVLCRRPHRTNYADRLTIDQPCRTPGNGDEAGRGAAKTRSGRPRGEEEEEEEEEEEDRLQSALIDPVHAGAVLLTWRISGAPKVLGGCDSACGVVNTLAMADEAGASGRRPALLPFVRSRRPTPSAATLACRAEGEACCRLREMPPRCPSAWKAVAHGACPAAGGDRILLGRPVPGLLRGRQQRAAPGVLASRSSRARGAWSPLTGGVVGGNRGCQRVLGDARRGAAAGR